MLARLFPPAAWAALVSALLTVGLGGVVRVTGSGLGCPDWPLCYGGLIPPPDPGAWLEYIHRLSASTTSLLTVLMTLSAWRWYGLRNRKIILALLPLPLLVGQVGLGAYTVLQEVPPLPALVHTATAIAFVGSLSLVVTGTAPWRAVVTEGSKALFSLSPGVLRYRRLVLGLGVAAFLLVISGAYVTRSGASLACPSFPLCGSAAPSAAAQRLQEIHMLHRGVALLVVILMVWTLWETWRLRPPIPSLRALATGATALLGLQVSLGVSNVLLRLPLWSQAGHVALTGAYFATLMLLVGTLWQPAGGKGKEPGPLTPESAAKPPW